MVVIVGGSLEPLDTALESLDSQLLLGGPIVLLLAALAAYVLAGSALGPVEAMRRRAAAFSANDLEQRQPEPAADDELGRLAHTLNAMLERVEHAVRKERTFIANASHELRSPLATLQAELELIARDRPHGNALDHQVASAIEETGRLTEITSALLLLAHADSHELVLRRHPVEVDALLADATTRTGHADPHVTIKSAPGLIIDADRELLTQALCNLIANARRYTHTGVTVTASADNNQLELRVTDDGDGFPEGFLPRAFDRFSRADKGRTGDGAGLGLSIVQAVAQLHRGSVHATNRQTGGGDVRIRLPTNPAEPRHPRPDAAPESPASTPQSIAARG